MHQTEIRKGRRPASVGEWRGGGGLIPLIVGSEEKLAAPARSLSQASYTGKRRMWWWRVGWGGGVDRGVLCYSPSPLIPPSSESAQTLLLWHLGWQTELLSFQYWNKTEGLSV